MPSESPSTCTIWSSFVPKTFKKISGAERGQLNESHPSRRATHEIENSSTFGGLKLQPITPQMIEDLVTVRSPVINIARLSLGYFCVPTIFKSKPQDLKSVGREAKIIFSGKRPDDLLTTLYVFTHQPNSLLRANSGLFYKQVLAELEGRFHIRQVERMILICSGYLIANLKPGHEWPKGGAR